VSIISAGRSRCRKTPASFVVPVSADNRYRLFVNGHFVAAGPAQSDLRNWRFETIDLAPHLKAPPNVLAAVVLNGSHFEGLAPLYWMAIRIPKALVNPP
jgi:hypothetical protein